MGTAGRDFEERDRREDDEQCRICANDVTRKDGVNIFAEEGKRHYLQTNIRKYLYILVSFFLKSTRCSCKRHIGGEGNFLFFFKTRFSRFQHVSKRVLFCRELNHFFFSLILIIDREYWIFKFR